MTSTFHTGSGGVLIFIILRQISQLHILILAAKIH